MMICFRADASLEIGTGHVMRCLTLAQLLQTQGHSCIFLCKRHEGHLVEHIESLDFHVEIIETPPRLQQQFSLTHASWLGSTQEEDAKACASILERLKPHWLVVDHYALDILWEQTLAPYYQKLLVIDDLADRKHLANLLLDQNYGRNPNDYHNLVPPECTILTGPTYALLRPEFAQLRPYSLARREQGHCHNLLLNLGGVDQNNISEKLLNALTLCNFPKNFNITVVLGPKSPWQKEVKNQACKMPWPTQVLVGTNQMAQLMADHDLAIGAAGSTTWERCCLGLPTIMIVIAANQQLSAQALSAAGISYVLNSLNQLDVDLPSLMQSIDPIALQQMVQKSSTITMGTGANQICQIMALIH
ncbi:UDP-2,4-diacetamido-2,4,6-trideoxy-beta-L-altropyranose hydrolase [Neisseriaceae bacterium CLB008]